MATDIGGFNVVYYATLLVGVYDGESAGEGG
jgi:hypothetical protein